MNREAIVTTPHDRAELANREAIVTAQRDRAEFARRAARFRLRSPARSTRGLIRGVALEHGTCLDPLMPPDGTTEAFFDRELAPVDGDLCLIEYSNGWMERVQTAAAKDPDFYAAWLKTDTINGVMPRLAAKLYVVRDGVPFVLCKDYAIKLERVGRVVGVCRALRTPRERLKRAIVLALTFFGVTMALTILVIYLQLAR